MTCQAFIKRGIPILFFFLSFPYVKAQMQYSAFDKARIIVGSDEELIDYYVLNNARFDSATIAMGISSRQALNYFRNISFTDSLFKKKGFVEKFDLVRRRKIDVTPLVKIKAINPSFDVNGSTAFSQQSRGEIQRFLVELNQPLTNTQEQEVLGTAVVPSGANFTTNLIEAAADLLLDRGKKELANSFYGELSDKLGADEGLSTLFPNTTSLFINRDPFMLPSLGPTWQRTFELDLQQLPENLLGYLNKELPEQKDQLEVVLAFYKLIREIEQGVHPHEAINTAFLSISVDNPYGKPFLLMGVLNKELKVRRLESDPNQNQVWATPADFRALGSSGQAIFTAYLLNSLQEKGLITSELDGSKLNQAVSQISALISFLKNAEQAVESILKGGEEERVSRFADVTNAMTGVLSNAMLLHQWLSPDSVLDPPGVEEIHHRMKALEKLIRMVTEAVQAAKSGDYGKLPTYVLQIFKVVNEKKYGEIEAKLDTVRINISNKLSELNRGSLAPVIAYFGDKDNFRFEDTQQMSVFATQITDFVFTKWGKRLKGKLREKVYTIIRDEMARLLTKAPDDFIKIAVFVTEVAQASSAEQIQAVLDANILPVGSFRMKRRPYQSSLFLQGFAGFNGGYEFLNRAGADVDYDGFQGGLFLPIGFEYTFSGTKPAYHGLFVSLLDVGAVGSFNLSNDDDLDVPSLRWDQVFSPGLFYTRGFKKIPVTWGAGLRYTPALRKIDVGDEDPVAVALLDGKTLSALQFNVFIAVDVPLVRLLVRKK